MCARHLVCARVPSSMCMMHTLSLPLSLHKNSHTHTQKHTCLQGLLQEDEQGPFLLQPKMTLQVRGWEVRCLFAWICRRRHVHVAGAQAMMEQNPLFHLGLVSCCLGLNDFLPFSCFRGILWTFSMFVCLRLLLTSDETDVQIVREIVTCH